jgi:LAO/AO transport system kinase
MLPGAGPEVDADRGPEDVWNYYVPVLCVDPFSPFNLGALLGDRIRKTEW